MKGHKEDICNEEQQVTTSLQICTCQREADTCDRYILLSTCLVQNPMCSQQHGGQGSKASLSAWRHSEALMESLGVTFFRSAPCKRAWPAGGFFKPCQRTGWRSHAWWHLTSLVLNAPVPSWFGHTGACCLLEGQQVCLCALLILLVVWSHLEGVRMGSFRSFPAELGLEIRLFLRT